MVNNLAESGVLGLQSLIVSLQSPIVTGSADLDAWAGGIIVIGILCQVLHRRMPAGLGTCLFVGAATVGSVLAAFGHDWPASGRFYLLCRAASISCVVWACLGWFSSRQESKKSVTTTPDPSAIFFAWSLVCGVAAVVVAIYFLIFETCLRLLDPNALAARLTVSGLWDLGALILATGLWTAAVRRRQQPVMFLMLAALLVWWTSLMIPSVVGSYRVPSGALLPFQPAWWTWTFQMQFGLAVVLFVAAVLQEIRYRTRRRRAWPDHLDDLLQPYSRWPAYIQVEAVIAAAILVLGVYEIVREGPPSWQLGLASAATALVASLTCLFMTYRRWSANTAGLGMALLALAAVSIACAVVTWFDAGDETPEYAERMPVLFNAVLGALTLMIAFWGWLSRFWRQQLLNGTAWTTAGRMIPYARRTAYLLTALAVLVAFQMALWPQVVPASSEDNTIGRLMAGAGSLLILAWVTARNARRTGSIATASLCVALLLACLIFLFIRMPTSSARGWLIQYQAVVFATAALPILLGSEVLPPTQWKTFSMPLWFLALLILPAGSLIALLLSARLPADWVRPATLAILGLVYSYAGSHEHRRAFLVLGGVLLLAALTGLYHAYGAT